MGGARKILVSCGGLGMGNASRIYAIAQAMLRSHPNAQIHFFTWGKGFSFLSQVIPAGSRQLHLHALEPYPWRSRARVPGWRAVTMLVDYARAYARNVRILARATRELSPEVILLDSDYHFPAFLGRTGKLYFLGQAIDVIERAKNLGYRPGMAARLSLLAGEVGDGFVQRLFSDRVFVPSFLEKEEEAGASRAIRVPLIVRDEFRSTGPAGPTSGTLAVASGSGIERERLSGIVSRLGGKIFSDGEGGMRPTSPADIQSADFVVIQGGLSSISECIALRKPMVVVPIRGRAEQEVNARTVESLGLGISCEDDDWQRNGLSFAVAPLAEILVHGAEVVARHVFADA